MKRSARFCFFFLGTVLTTHAAVIQPCSPGANNENIIPVVNAFTAYCVSDFGWSDTWYYAPIPLQHSAFDDVLSGDDAVNLRFSINGNVASGIGWLTPSLDAGTLKATNIGSPWQVVNPVDYVNADSTHAQSVIKEPASGLQVTIDTFVSGVGVTQTYLIKNTGNRTVQSIRFADYFNYHPRGSAAGGFPDAVVQYMGASGLYTSTANLDNFFIMNGSMRGQKVDDAHDLGKPADVIADVQGNKYNGLAKWPPNGELDAAGALAWDLGDLASGKSVQFTISKNPEPGTFILMLAGVGALGIARRRRKSIGRRPGTLPITAPQQ